MQVEVSNGDSDYTLNLDRALMRQVLSNLIRNAVEANPGAETAMKLRAWTEKDLIF